MSTATAETETETETQTQPKVRFMSRSANQVLTRRKTRFVANDFDEKTLLGEEEWQERQRELNEKREAAGEPIKDIDTSPWKVEFGGAGLAPHVFETDDPVLIDYLRNHRLMRFNGSGAFWEVEPPLEEREPTVDAQLKEIGMASIYQSVERVEVVKEIEEDTHKRPVVLKAAEAALENLRALSADSAGDANSENGAPSSTSLP